MEEIKIAVHGELGISYDVRTQKITKNNGVVLDGLIIGETGKRIVPTIYLNPYYLRFKRGTSLPEILAEVISEYRENSDIVILLSSVLAVILVPDRGGPDYGELQKMVSQVNKNEVSEEYILLKGI